jgi:hypothetical protein
MPTNLTQQDKSFLTANKPGTLTFLSQVTVGGTGGTVATEFAAQTCGQGVWIQALSTNTASVWIGESDASTTKGREIVPGDEKFFPCTNMDQLKHLSTTTGQKINLMVL